MLRKLFFNYMYFKKPPWDTGIVPPELVRFTENHPPGRALDLGCGTGTNAIYLAKNGWDVTAVDFSRRALSIAKRKASFQQVNIKFLLDDVSKLSRVTGKFDLILDIGCFHGLNPTQKEQYLINIEKFLSATGTYLLYGFISTSEQTVRITKADIQRLQQSLMIIQQEFGLDHTRTSAWFTIQKKV